MQKTFTLNRSGGLEGIDFRSLGFKCGLEIHHQIKTEKKLFCRCPAGKYSNEYHAEALRHMRPTLSELGEYDGTALMEFKTQKEIIYRLHKETVCTYELDDNPPFPINMEAVNIAVEVALLLNCQIVSEIHIARKQYLDGSIPAGFQRTTIIGVDGWIPYKDRKIGITQLALEEDACREHEDKGHRITFYTDRLSMPLIEVVTAPDMLDPVEAAEVGALIGTLLRLTGKVNRGAGAVRQDVNVSISGGTRVEIKGVPKLGFIPRLTGFEAARQKALQDIKEEVQKRGIIKEDDFKYDVKDVSSLIGSISHLPIRDRFPQYRRVKAVCFKGLGGIFSRQLNPGWSFASEVSARIRVIACIDEMPNLAHTDRSDSFSLDSHDTSIVFTWFNCTTADVVILVWGSEHDVDTAIDETIIRVKETMTGVINETRQHRPNGVSDFERILPGPDRMYPDTDSPPTQITDEMIERISANLPETPWIKMEKLTKLGVKAEIAWNLLHSPYLNAFESASKDYPDRTGFLGKIVLQYIPQEVKRHLVDWAVSDVEKLLKFACVNDLPLESVIDLLHRSNGRANWESLYDSRQGSEISPKDLDLLIKKIVDDQKIELKQGFIIGEVKKRLAPTVSGKIIAERVAAVVKNQSPQ